MAKTGPATGTTWSDADSHNVRRIGPLAATALVVASMVGTGIFVTSGYLAQGLHSAPWVLGVWLLGGLLSLSGATVYAELGAMMPRAGGEYVFLSRAFGPGLGFLSGWVSLWVGFSAPIAAAATACAYYASSVVPLPSVRAAACVLILAVSLVHMVSVAAGARLQVILTGLKVTLLVAFSLAAILVGRGSFAHFAPSASAPVPGALATALVLAAFAYSGFNAAAYVAGEVRNPARSLPRALVGGTLLVTLLYLVLNVALFYALPPAALGVSPEIVVHAAARALFGPDVARYASLAIALALVSSVSAMVLSGPRVYQAMADDGLFFRSLTRTSNRGAPYVAVGLQGVLASLMAITASFEALLTYIGFSLSAFSALTVLGAARLRKREPMAPRPYRALAWPFSAIAYVGLSAWMVTFSIAERPVVALAAALTLLSGLAWYGLWTSFGALRSSFEHRRVRSLQTLTPDRRTYAERRHRRRWQPKMPRPLREPHPRASRGSSGSTPSSLR